MSLTLSILAWLFAVPLTLMLVYFAIELLVGLPASVSSKRADNIADAVTICVLIPAHNEEHSVAKTVHSVLQSDIETKCLVVADNCTDRTATAAAQAGSEVVTRFNENEKGKGFALAFGRDHLAKDPPDIVVVIDADCEVATDMVRLLTIDTLRHKKIAQASNLFLPDRSVSASVQVSNFAMLVKNFFRMRGMFRLGGTVSLLGTGTAFPWGIFAKLPLGTNDAVEDIQIAMDHVDRGERIWFNPEAQVWSAAENTTQTLAQRKRWEHGFLNHATNLALPLFIKGLLSLSRSKIFYALHMMVPPLAMLFAMALGTVALAFVSYLVSGSLHPLSIIAFGLVFATISLAAAWIARGHQFLSPTALLRIPMYLLWKIPVYFSLFTRRQKNWGDDKTRH